MNSRIQYRTGVARGAMLLALMLTGAVQAQTVQAQAAPASSEDLPQPAAPSARAEPVSVDGTDEIVVTGSRIRRPDFDTPSPVVTVDAATLRQSGQTNLTNVLVGIPALQNSENSLDNSGSSAGVGGAGLNLLNLRNLGTERTLVLIDGRRQVASVPGSQAVDINTIPADLVERIDVLTGGASAIYGADAVTGVVNFVMKRDFEGLTARAQAGISTRGDAGQRLLSVTAGRNFADGRGNVALAYEFGSESRLESRDRSYLRGTQAVGFFVNPDDPRGLDDGVPDYIPLNNVRYFDSARAGGIDVDFDAVPDFISIGGRAVPFDPGRFVPTAFQQGGSGTLLSDYANDLQPDNRRHIVNAMARFAFSPAVEVFVEGKYANTRSFTLGQPSFDFALLLPADNPYLPSGLPVSADGVLLNRDNFDIGQRGSTITRETFRGVTGLRGELGPNARYELSYTFGQTDVTNRYVNDLFNDRYFAALDTVRLPSGQITCRVNVDPNWTPDQPFNPNRVFAPTTFRPGECVPFNPFGEGQASPAALDFVRADTTNRARLRQNVVSGSLSGDFGQIFTLPGGPVGFALGAEYRKEESRFTPDALSAQGLTFGNRLGATRGSFDVKEVFGELSAPLLSDLPFAHRLTVGAALRLSDYSTIGRTTAWKVDGSWAPVRDLTFNGTYSVSVRAPNISELFGASSQTFAFIADPCNNNEIQNGTQFRAANCRTLLTGLGVANPATYLDTRSTSLPGFQGGNAALQEEEAKTWTAGAVIQPRFIPGLLVRADWYDTRIEGAINTVTARELAELCVDQPTLQNQFCSAITRTATTVGTTRPGNITSFLVTPQNVARFSTAGLDVNISYQLRTASAGDFALRVVGNYLDKLEFIGSPGADITNRRQENAFRAPKFQVSPSLTWSLDGVSLGYSLLWMDKTLRNSNQINDNNPDRTAPEYKFIKPLALHNLNFSIQANERFQFFGGVTNVFDQKPDLGNQNYFQQLVGRYVFAGARITLPRF
ncbi:TonB-dependent receptor plug domain-containing protein [Sphingomonas sp. 1P08PE]|uniref:TonB-dependent receptor plug domain-containing protein n=1 Tax=Sphingomonas sp. 1P08PE TaxID=554122 RepID=UPI0039A1D2F2